MNSTTLFSEKNKPRYLEALNEALIKHPDYKLGMKFCDIELVNDVIHLLVVPTGITQYDDALKAFNDLATILTISGSTLEYKIIERD